MPVTSYRGLPWQDSMTVLHDPKTIAELALAFVGRVKEETICGPFIPTLKG